MVPLSWAPCLTLPGPKEVTCLLIECFHTAVSYHINSAHLCANLSVSRVVSPRIGAVRSDEVQVDTVMDAPSVPCPGVPRPIPLEAHGPPSSGL